MVHAAPFFEETNRNVLDDPRVHLTIQDGRNFLLTSDEKYDVIRLDPPELHTAGVVNLYTREFFTLARDHLEDDGIFSIWVNISYTPEESLRQIMATAAEVFPNVQVWHGPFWYGWVINGSKQPHDPDMRLIRERFADPKIRSDLASFFVKSPLDVLGLWVMADDEVRAFAGHAPVITDDRTRLDFDVPKAQESAFGVSNHITGLFLEEFTRSNKASIELMNRYCRYKEAVLPHVVGIEEAGFSRDELARGLAEKEANSLCKRRGA